MRIAGRGIFPICGSATVRFFPTVGGVNPSLTIQAIACRAADRIKAMAARRELLGALEPVPLPVRCNALFSALAALSRRAGVAQW